LRIIDDNADWRWDRKSEKDSLGVGSSASIMKLINSRETRIFDLGPLGQI
jgi:hypothetical protein